MATSVVRKRGTNSNYSPLRAEPASKLGKTKAHTEGRSICIKDKAPRESGKDVLLGTYAENPSNFLFKKGVIRSKKQGGEKLRVGKSGVLENKNPRIERTKANQVA